MTSVPTPLASVELLAHARAAARADERRHSAAAPRASLSQRNEQTLRGWGGAALLDLEWTSQCVYSKAAKGSYRDAYATEYLRRLLQRAGQLVSPAVATVADPSQH